MSTAETSRLRPLERVILRLEREGHSLSEIAAKVGKRPGTVGRIRSMIDYRTEEQVPRTRGDGEVLRPIERVVLRALERGETFGEIGNRLRTSGAHARRIAAYARFKQGEPLPSNLPPG